MSVKAPLPRIYWVLSGLLCLITLVALWITAWKIRGQKVEARRAGRQEPPSETDRLRRLPIRRNGAVRAGHFQLSYPNRDGALAVIDPFNKPYVTFTGFREGERRAWQELQITCVAADEGSYVVDVEFVPGSSCRGPGDYARLKEGLRIELDGDKAITVLRWDAAAPEVVLSTPLGEARLRSGGEWVGAPYRAKLLDTVLHIQRD